MITKNHDTSQTDAVSESIGFLLIFTIVIVGIGLVTLYGYPMLLQQQSNADEQIMEKNMIVLQNDMKGVVYKTVPYKETSLKIGGGALTVRNSSFTPAYSSITIKDNSGDIVTAFTPGDLVYRSTSAGTEMALQNGAVIKRQVATGGSVMLAEPRWFYDGQTDTMVVTLVRLTSDDIISRAGVGTVQMALGETDFILRDTAVLPSTLNPPVELVYTPSTDPEHDYSTAWDSYFQKTLGMSRTAGTPGTGLPVTYRMPATISRLVIKTYDVKILSL